MKSFGGIQDKAEVDMAVEVFSKLFVGAVKTGRVLEELYNEEGDRKGVIALPTYDHIC